MLYITCPLFRLLALYLLLLLSLSLPFPRVCLFLSWLSWTIPLTG